jgi:hypothetical protein
VVTVCSLVSASNQSYGREGRSAGVPSLAVVCLQRGQVERVNTSIRGLKQSASGCDGSHLFGVGCVCVWGGGGGCKLMLLAT